MLCAKRIGEKVIFFIISWRAGVLAGLRFLPGNSWKTFGNSRKNFLETAEKLSTAIIRTLDCYH